MKILLKKLLAFMALFLQLIWKKLIKPYPEVLSVPAAFLVWIVSIPVLRWLDPTSAVFDAGVFQVPIFSVLQMFVYVSIAWLILRTVFGTASKFLMKDLKTSFETLTSWQKIVFSYGLFFSLLFSLVALSYTLR